MSGERPDCLSCGLCCRMPAGPPDPYPEDLERWVAEGLPEIACRLRAGRNSDCPFLVSGSGFRCAIYPTRPLVCRHFAAGGSACLALRASTGSHLQIPEFPPQPRAAASTAPGRSPH